MIPINRPSPARRHRPLKWAGLLFGGLVTAAIPAQAQNSGDFNLSVPGVTVDLSVLNDDGQRSAISPTARGGTSSGPKSHLLPGKLSPVSTLYIAPQGDYNKRLAPLVQAPVLKAPVLKAPRVEASKTAATKTTTQTSAVETPPTVAEIVAAPEPPPIPELPTPAPVVEAPPPAPAPMIAEPEPVKAVAEPVVAVEPVPEPEPVAEVTPAPAPMPEPEPKAAPAPVVEAVPAPPPAPEPPAAEVPIVTAELPPAPVVEKPPVAVSKPSATVASLTPSQPTLGDGDSLTVSFESESSKLSGDAREQLQALAESLRTQKKMRLQLLAYAGNIETPSSTARRLSLSRALAVRSLLIESGVRSTRIDVRALGNKSTDANTERVDITVIER